MLDKITDKYRQYRTEADEYYKKIFNPKYQLSRVEKVVKYAISAYKTNASNEIGFKCSALVYHTVFAIVPILALVFSVTDGLGMDDAIDKIAGFVLTDTPGVMDKVFEIARGAKIDATSGIVTTISSLFLLWSVWTLMDRVTMVFQDIWRNQINPKEERPFGKRLIYRLSLLLLSPFVIVVMYAGISLITFMETFIIRKLGIPAFFNFFNYLIVYAAIAGVFSAMYKYIPSVKVKWSHALASGFVAAFIFALFQLFYIFVQSKVSRYNLVYGALAAFPLFLLWAYYSWELIIKGAVLCHTLENPEEYNFVEEEEVIPEDETVGARILKDVKTLGTDLAQAVGEKLQDLTGQKNRQHKRKGK